MAQPTTAEHRGAGPTRQGDTGSGLDAPVAGGALLLTLYGLAVIVADLFGEHLVPDSGLAVAGIMIGCLVVGAVVGGFVLAALSRD